MQNGVQLIAFLGIGKDELSERAAVKRVPAEYAVPKSLTNGGERRAAVGCQCAGNRVGIDNRAAQRREIGADGAFAAGNGSG